MSEKVCTHCKTDENDSFAMELLKGYSAQAKRWFIACMVILSMWLATIAGFVWYLNQYDFESYETIVEQNSEDGGDTNYIGNDGDIYNGLSKGDSSETNP